MLYDVGVREQSMKIRIELDASVEEIEVTIKAPELNQMVIALQNQLLRSEKSSSALLLFQEESQYFVEMKELLFFETDETKVFAHTRDQILQSREKLYQLEKLLPETFFRVSKSAIVNCQQIYALDRSFSGSCMVRFSHSNKTVYVSRHYYKGLLARLKEVRKIK